MAKGEIPSQVNKAGHIFKELQNRLTYDEKIFEIVVNKIENRLKQIAENLAIIN